MPINKSHTVLFLKNFEIGILSFEFYLGFEFCAFAIPSLLNVLIINCLVNPPA
jgi:hypothetical protein